MSVPRSTPLDRSASESLSALPRPLVAAARLASRPVRFVAFWVAALLPLLYVPLLATGAAVTHRVGFAGLLGLNAVAFVVGHPYNRPD